MKLRSTTIRLGVALAVLALPAAALATPRPIPDHAKHPVAAVKLGTSIASVDLVAANASIARRHGSVYVTLNNVAPRALATIVGARRDGDHRLAFSDSHRELAAAALHSRWNRTVGSGASLRVESDKGRTTLFNLTGTPTWNPRLRQLTFAANATPQNAAAASKAVALGNALAARITPAPVVRRSRIDHPLRPRQTTSSPTCTTIQPSRAGTNFCLAYDPALGSGGQSWVNLLSGTMQTTPSCQTLPPPTQIGGNVQVTGQIDVYDSASEAQAALSASANVGYSSKIVSGEAQAAFSTNSQTSDTSVYAIAQVNVASGTVNFGTPTLTPQRQSDAAAIGTFDDALGFIADCGDSVPVSYTVGASWMAVLQLQTSSQADQSSLNASISGSYKGASAGINFSANVEHSSETTNITETDACAGPANCFGVSGYTAPATAGSDIAGALTIFENNYSIMLSNLAASCTPGETYSSCITQVQYQPLYKILPAKSALAPTVDNPKPLAPSTLVSNAATAIYAVQSNFNSWATGYQGLETSFPTDPAYWTWNQNLGNLSYTAPYCDISGLSGPTCSEHFNDCSQYILKYLSSAGAPCLPSAFEVNDLSTVVNPATIKAPTSGS